MPEGKPPVLKIHVYTCSLTFRPSKEAGDAETAAAPPGPLLVMNLPFLRSSLRLPTKRFSPRFSGDEGKQPLCSPHQAPSKS